MLPGIAKLLLHGVFPIRLNVAKISTAMPISSSHQRITSGKAWRGTATNRIAGKRETFFEANIYIGRARVMLKKGLVVGTGLVLLAGLFFGRDVYSYVKTSSKWVHDSVKGSVPVTFELERARNMIADLDPEISRHKREIAREELELRNFQAQFEAEKDMLARKWREIQRLRDDLARGDSNFTYAGMTFTAQQVEADLTNRFNRYETMVKTQEKHEKILQARQKGLQAAQDKLKEMIAAKRQLEVEVANLDARLKMVEVAKASSNFQIDDSQLSRTRKLLTDIEARIEIDAQLVNAGDVFTDEIPLAEPTDKTDILKRITQFESSNPVPAKLAEAKRSR
jgi:hypothetical protein